MDFEVDGKLLSVDATDQPDDLLIRAAMEIADEADRRQIAFPFVSGIIDLETGRRKDRIPKEIMEELSTCFSGYKDTVAALNETRGQSEKIPVVEDFDFDYEFDDWFTNDRLEYVKAELANDPDVDFTLIAIPNVTVEATSIKDAAERFGRKLSVGTHVDTGSYSEYTADQLAGTNPKNGKQLQFALISSRYETSAMYGPVTEQKEKLAEIQATKPFLRVPTVLEAVALWYTLNAQGYDFGRAQGRIYDLTYIRHFDLPAVQGIKGVGTLQERTADFVLASAIKSNSAYIAGSDSNDSTYARLLVA